MLPNGDEGFVGKSRGDVCLAGCDRHVRKREKGGIGGPHGGTIGKADEDSISGGYQIVTGSCGAKEMATTAILGDGAMGRVVGN